MKVGEGVEHRRAVRELEAQQRHVDRRHTVAVHASLELGERSRTRGVDDRAPTARRRRVPATLGETCAVVEVVLRHLSAKVDAENADGQTTPPYLIATSMPSIFAAPNSLLANAIGLFPASSGCALFKIGRASCREK